MSDPSATTQYHEQSQRKNQSPLERKDQVPRKAELQLMPLIITAVITTVIGGAIGVVFSSVNTRNEFDAEDLRAVRSMTVEISFIKDMVTELRDDADSARKDRWTRTEQAVYAASVESQFAALRRDMLREIQILQNTISQNHAQLSEWAASLRDRAVIDRQNLQEHIENHP